MNGDFLELWQKFDDRISRMEEKQNTRHEENIKTFGRLPCKAQAVKINLTYALIMIMVSGCVGGFWWLLRR